THALLRGSARHAQRAAARAAVHGAEPVAANASNVIPFAHVITRS
ncbi:glycosyl transferase family 9, partial [Burkholderia territorii]